MLTRFLTLAPALGLVVALGYIAVRHQRIFLAIFMLLAALENTRDFAPGLAMTFAGASFYPNDLVVVLCATAALARIGRWRLSTASRIAGLLLLAFVGVGVIAFISMYGLQIGVNFWRPQMLMIALLMYTTTRPRAWSWGDLRFIIVGPAMVVALASVVGILLFGAGSASSVVLVNGVSETGRPVFAAGSLMMVIALWVTALEFGRWGAARVMVILLLGSMVILTQNRSVWAASIIGFIVWWLAPRIRNRGMSGGLGGANRTIVVFLVASATALVGVSVQALGQSASDDKTWLWRVARWAGSMSIPRSWVEWLAGSALGPTPAAAAGLFPAHSLYVIAIEQTGFLGLAAVLYLLIASRNAWFPPSNGPLSMVICIIFLSYGVAYPLPPWTWMLIGIFLASTSTELPQDFRKFTPARMQDLTEARNFEQHLADRPRL